MPLLSGFLTGLFLLMNSTSHSAETGGIEFPNRIELSKQALVLNGLATRSVFGVRVYEAGLYVSKATSDAEEILRKNEAPKRLRLVMQRAVEEDKFSSAVRDNIARNFSDAELGKFSKDFDAFFKCFENGPKLDKGTEVCIDYLPGEGTIVRVAGQNLQVIPGHEFYHALLLLWIGNPLQSSIKTGLLGSHHRSK